MSRLLFGAIAALFSLAIAAHSAADGPPAAEQPDRGAALRNCFGTYAAPPRDAQQRVDVDALLHELTALKANSYNWLIGAQATDWDDLQRFLPLARAAGIRVWATLLPPSESKPGHYSEPHRTDYLKWAEALGALSQREPALVAWSIDDFAHNLATYTPELTRTMVERAREQNPRLAFVPCVYFRQMSAQFAQNYEGSLDGILFPFRNESVVPNLTDPTQVASEVDRTREWFGTLPIIIDVYVDRHSQLGGSTTEYVRDVMASARGCADGVMIYCHPSPKKNEAKYEVVRRLFHLWAAQSH
jgi:hypothetical protein